jgi:hypothetical protein
MRARIPFNDTLDPACRRRAQRLPVAGCKELGIADSDRLAVGAPATDGVYAAMRDPISGTPSHRFNMCEVRPVEREAQAG